MGWGKGKGKRVEGMNHERVGNRFPHLGFKTPSGSSGLLLEGLGSAIIVCIYVDSCLRIGIWHFVVLNKNKWI